MPTYDTTTVPGVRILEGSNPISDIDEGMEAMAVDLGKALGSFSAHTIPSGAGGSSGGVFLFGTEDWDVSSAYNPANGRYTPPVAGIYRLTVCVKGNSATFAITVNKNGSPFKTVSARADFSDPQSLTVKADAGDYFTVESVTIPSGFLTGSGNYFQGELVGRT